jgi:hypothetical protein
MYTLRRIPVQAHETLEPDTSVRFSRGSHFFLNAVQIKILIAPLFAMKKVLDDVCFRSTTSVFELLSLDRLGGRSN